jgi:heptosyltransferase-1
MKILVVRLSSLGDVLHLFPAVTDLSHHFHGSEIHWMVEPAFAELAGWHSSVNKVIPVPLRNHKKFWWRLPGLLLRLRRRLRAERYDIVLDAQGLLKSAVLARLAGVPVFGFARDSAREALAASLYKKTASVESGLHVVEKNRQLVAKIFGADISAPADFGLAKFRDDVLRTPFPSTMREITGKPYVILLHGTTWNSKYWPEESWAQLIRHLATEGWRTLLPWGTDAELQRAGRLRTACGAGTEVLPRLSLTDLTNVLLHASYFVSVESGIGHIAAVLDVPGIMLHGPTDPAYSGILGKKCRHLSSGLYCAPCFKRNCPRIENSQEVPPCQAALTPLQVFAQCRAMASPKAGGIEA